MNKHTPGPWGLETVPTSAGSCHKIGPFPSIGVRPQVHACVYADGIHLGLDEKSPVAVELLANARLIAAAPELLELALELKAELELIAMEEGAEPYNNPRLNEVLAKATGAA